MKSKDYVSTVQQKIAKLAKIHPDLSFTSLAHHINLQWLYVAYLETRKDGAVGVDNQTAEEYAKDLKSNLENLLNSFKTGRYKAPQIRRVFIPKGNGKELRPLGIPTFEDKILQRAVLMLIEEIYEKDFYECSCGFRKGRSQHQALNDIRDKIMKVKGCWIIDLDIRKYFDSIDHGKLREIFKSRVCDGVINRQLGKWLKAGILEQGNVSYPEFGVPQGGVISPILSNIYLHEILDKWFTEIVKPRISSNSFLIRFADDAIMGFSSKEEALKVMEVLPKRFGKYGLELHPDKTKLIDFTRPRYNSTPKDNKCKTFNFLGFTHYWGKTRKGYWIVKQKTDKERLKRSITKINEWSRKNRHMNIKEQHNKLSKKLNGHYAYYGITHNIRSLGMFYENIRKIWRKWLNKRSHRSRMNWDTFEKLLKKYPLPKPRIVHSIYMAKL